MSTGDDTARIFADRYVIDRKITSAESCEVWKAHDDLVGRAVAVKIWFGPTVVDDAWRTRFRHSASRLAAFSHPGVARCHEFDTSEDEAWLASAWVDGVTLTDALRTEPAMSTERAVDIVGQVAIALAAVHDAGITHGRLSADAVLVRSGDVASLIGFAVDGDGSRTADLEALGSMAANCVRSTTPEPPPEVNDFLSWLTDPTHRKPANNAAEIGRTALALAATLRGQTPPPITKAGDDKPEKSSWRREETSAEEASRKQVRNRLLVLGTIVVVGGAGLLRFVGKSGGEVTVPTVTQFQVNQAALKLTTAGLVPLEVCKVGNDSGGVVTEQFPVAGDRVKAGTTIHLTVPRTTCP